jgi:hypothetical protein
MLSGGSLSVPIDTVIFHYSVSEKLHLKYPPISGDVIESREGHLIGIDAGDEIIGLNNLNFLIDWDGMEYLGKPIKEGRSFEDGAMTADKATVADPTRGGIDFNSANLAMLIKRDGKGVVLPLAQQDLAQLSRLIGDGLEPHILSIIPASQSSVFAQLVAHR